MGNYDQLKADVNAVVRTNGRQEITGQRLQNVLNNIISVVGAYATFGGVATPSTNPGVLDQNVFYIAAISGAYPNFGGLTVGDKVCIFSNSSGSWVKTELNIYTSEKVDSLVVGSDTNFAKTKLDKVRINYDRDIIDSDYSFIDSIDSIELINFTELNARHAIRKFGYDSALGYPVFEFVNTYDGEVLTFTAPSETTRPTGQNAYSLRPTNVIRPDIILRLWFDWTKFNEKFPNSYYTDDQGKILVHNTPFTRNLLHPMMQKKLTFGTQFSALEYCIADCIEDIEIVDFNHNGVNDIFFLNQMGWSDDPSFNCPIFFFLSADYQSTFKFETAAVGQNVRPTNTQYYELRDFHPEGDKNLLLRIWFNWAKYNQYFPDGYYPYSRKGIAVFTSPESLIKINGNGGAFLADDGTYKAISGGSNIVYTSYFAGNIEWQADGDIFYLDIPNSNVTLQGAIVSVLTDTTTINTAKSAGLYNFGEVYQVGVVRCFCETRPTASIHLKYIVFQ